MLNSFELFIARRYLRAKRRQAVISVITIISILGVAAGVMALVVALAINTGFRNTLQANLLGATAHVSLLEKEPAYGIANWAEIAVKVRRLPHVTGVTPTLYGNVFFSGPLQSQGGILKGINPEAAEEHTPMLRRLKQGSLKALTGPQKGLPGIILGSRLAQSTGMLPGSVVRIISPQGELTPFGPKVTTYQFRVAGIFESGFYELDAAWAYTSLASAQMVLSLNDVVNSIEIKIDQLDLAPEIAKEAEALAGKTIAGTHWMEQNRAVLRALQMEKTVTVITIGLIQLVAALNILVALIMMVMEKHRDIAIFMSMGARHQQIRGIFMLQGVLIGVIGAAVGLVLGYTICWFANEYRWIRLDEEVYSLSFVPFAPRWIDGVWIAGVAILISFVATIYPARNATRIAPVEALRYE